jgi:hypothetical protein
MVETLNPTLINKTYEGNKVCVRVKDNSRMGALYRSEYELIFVFKRLGGSHH